MGLPLSTKGTCEEDIVMLKRIKTLLMIVVVVALLFNFQIPNGALASITNTDIWVADSLTDIWVDSVRPSNASRVLEVNTCKNEYESGQVAIRSSTPLTGLSVSVSNLTGAEGAQITDVTAKFVGTVNCRANSGQISAENLRFTAPQSAVPVYFRTESSIPLVANTTVSSWITVYVPSAAKAGRYSGTITINSNQGIETCQLIVNVYDITIPDASDSTAFNNLYTQNLCGLAPDLQSAETQNKDVYGYDNFSPDWWLQVENYAKEMNRNRMNVVSVYLYGLLTPDLQIDAAGNYIIDWTKFDRFVQTFIDHGNVKILNGLHLLCKRVDWDTPYVGWIFTKDTSGKITYEWKDPWSTEFDAHLNKLFPQLKDHLVSKGWQSMWYQSVGDEPLTTQQIDADKRIYDRVKNLSNGMKTLEAVNESVIGKFGTSLDVYVPRMDSYVYKKAEFDSLKNNGSSVWYYTSCGPLGDSLSRLEDYKLGSTRYLPWYAYKNAMPGYLNWALNQWVFGYVKNSPYSELCSASNFAGDGWTAYPDVAGRSFFSGPRLTAMRDGIEEYQLLKIYETKNPKEAKALVDAAVISDTQHDLTPSVINQKKLDLLLGASNCVKNAGFEETTTANYFGIWNANVQSATKRSGNNALRINSNGDGGLSQCVSVKPGTNYVVSAYVMTEASEKVRLSVDGYGGQSVVSPDYSCGEWKKVSIEFTTTPNQNSVDLHLWKSTQGAGNCYIDDIEIREKPAALLINNAVNSDFELGNTSGYFGAWNSSITSISPYSGSYCLKINGNTQGGISQCIVVEPNKNYRLSAWIKTTGSDTLYLSCDGYGGPSVRTADARNETWQQVILEFKTGPQQTSIDIHIGKSTQNGGDCFIDYLEVKERMSF